MNTNKTASSPLDEALSLTSEWDKVFPKSDRVEHRKVTFHNHFGLTLAADLYLPKGATGKLPAIAVCGLFYNPPIKKYKGSNQKVQKRDVFFAPRFLYPFHTSKGGIFAPFDRLLYFLEGRRVDQIEYDNLIAACLHCGTAAAEGGNRIAQRLTLEGIV